ncbi:MAG: hypothetical protein LUI01_00290 [Firmicutes bacterium]|nr:hypothetical protein [Bacillota bacterium]
MKKKKLTEAEKAARLYNAIFDTRETDYIDASDEMIKCSLDCAIKEAEYLKERTKRSDIVDGLKYLRRYIDNAETFLLERAEQYEVNGVYIPDEEDEDGDDEKSVGESVETYSAEVINSETGERRTECFSSQKDANDFIWRSLHRYRESDSE